MSSFNIPPSNIRRWSGPYLGNFYGTLWRTFNVDLDRSEGKVGLSRRLIRVADTLDTNSDTLGVITTFLRSNADCTDRWWGLSDTGRLYNTRGADPTNPADTWDVDTIASSPAICYDMTLFENDTRGDSINRNQLFVTLDSDIAVLNDTGNNVWNANWWVTKEGHAADSALDTGVPHPIQYFPFRRIVLVGSKNKVHTISRPSATVNDTSSVNRLVLPQDLQVEHIFTTSQRAYMLCSHLYGGSGKIVEWDGFSETYNEIYDLYSSAPLAGVNYREIPIVVNNKGMILEYTGGGFQPMVRDGQKIAFPVSEEQSGQVTDIKPRGMTVAEDGLIYMNVRHSGATGTAGSMSYRQASGIWCLNPISGRLYNKHAIGQWDTDVGAQRVNDVGAIQSLNPSNSTRTFVVGGSYLSNATTGNAGIWTLEAPTSSTVNRGYFITQYIPSVNVKDWWDTVWIKFKRFTTAANRIIVKGRGSGVIGLKNASYEPLDATITWASTTTFTVTLAAGDDALAVGDEVEVLGGDNAGYLAHITTIAGAHAAAQTITIDETVNNSTATALARFERWEKLGTISSITTYEDVVSSGIRGSFIQYKVELRGPYQELELESMTVSYEPDIFNKR